MNAGLRPDPIAMLIARLSGSKVRGMVAGGRWSWRYGRWFSGPTGAGIGPGELLSLLAVLAEAEAAMMVQQMPAGGGVQIDFNFRNGKAAAFSASKKTANSNSIGKTFFGPRKIAFNDNEEKVLGISNAQGKLIGLVMKGVATFAVGASLVAPGAGEMLSLGPLKQQHYRWCRFRTMFGAAKSGFKSSGGRIRGMAGGGLARR